MHKILSIVPVFIVLLVACESAPVQELTEARQAINATKAAGYDELSPLLDKAEKLIVQSEAAMYSGDYRNARASAEAAKIQALKVQKIITSRKQFNL